MSQPSFDGADVLRAPCAPPVRAPYLLVESPTLSRAVMGVVLSPFPVTYETHWIGEENRERLCCARSAPCPYHTTHSVRWWAAIAVRLFQTGGIRIVKVSAHAAQHCTSGHFRAPAKPCRGWLVRYARCEGGRHGKLLIELKPPTTPDDSLPAAPDLWPILRSMLDSPAPASVEGGST